MSRNRIPTRIKVTVLDLSEFEAEGLKYLRAHAQTDIELGKENVKMPAEVKTGETWGVVEIGGDLYALCTEGVGPDKPVTDETPLTLGLFVRRYEDDSEGKRFISMFPAATMKLKPAQLREAKTEQQIPLDEYIRSFGARLEANYEQWRMTLEDAEALVDNQDEIDRKIAEHEQAIFDNPDPAYGP